MKFFISILVLLSISGCTKEVPKQTKNTIKTNSFLEVWNHIISDKQIVLPQNSISYGKLSKDNLDIILQDAYRTLNSKADILKSFDKLVHPNGICFKGLWDINTPNIYSGYFKQNSKALIIARASTALSNTTNDTKRAFGFAGKLFPTTNPEQVNKFSSANFFVIDDLGGTNIQYYTDTSMTNEPKISFTFEVLKNLFYALKVSNTFKKVDKNSHIRQLYEISQLGENHNNIITPKWIKLEAQNMLKTYEKDFRNELKIKAGKLLVFNISVANKIINNSKNWKKIGTITLDTSVVSNSCDHNLHFHHPVWRDDINHGS